MRRFLSAFVLSLAVLPAWAFQEGDNLIAWYQKNGPSYQSSRVIGAMPGWDGWETAALGSDAGFSKPPFLLVLRQVNGTSLLPFGLVEGTATSPMIWYDTDGDGTIDYRSKTNFEPGWLALTLPGKRGDTKAIRSLADRIYRQYNRDQGPAPAELAIMVKELRARAIDPNDADRDLAAALAFYVDYGSKEPIAAAGTLGALARVLRDRGGVPPLVFLFLGESLGSAGNSEIAVAAFTRLLEVDPKSIIGAFKKAQVDKKALAEFTKAHPDFWTLR